MKAPPRKVQLEEIPVKAGMTKEYVSQWRKRRKQMCRTSPSHSLLITFFLFMFSALAIPSPLLFALVILSLARELNADLRHVFPRPHPRPRLLAVNCREVAALFGLQDHAENKRSAIVLDLYFNCLA